MIYGISGFVGGYLADEFIRHGYEVVGSDVLRNPVLPENISFYECDLNNYDQVADVIMDVSPDMIVNLAAISSVGASWNNPQQTISVNVIGALNLLEAARRLEAIPKLMFIGSSEEYEESNAPIGENTPLNANNPYGISKMAQEQFARSYRNRFGMKIYCVRPFNHTGIGQRDSFVLPSFCMQAAELERTGTPGVIKVGNLSARRDFSDVRDIVKAYRMIIESDDDSIIFNVGSGKAYSLQEMLDYIMSLCSVRVTSEIEESRFRPVDTPVICCDRSMIKEQLGWEPEHDIMETLKEMFEYYRDRK